MIDRMPGRRAPLVAVLDTSIGSPNVGDQIIMESVYRVIGRLLPDAQLISFPTQLRLGLRGLQLIRKADLLVVGGTNLLTSHMLSYAQWKINLLDTLIVKDAILLGVGWWQYQSKPDLYTRKLLSRALDFSAVQATRDGYTASKLKEMGFKNVLNTGCPTLWSIDNEELSKRGRKAKRVVATVTDYRQDRVRDQAMLDALRTLYEEVYIWPQGSLDLTYLRTELDIEGFTVLPPNLPAFAELLREGDCDYVGTRLHGGIKAMQCGCYARIVPVDNRSLEMGRDFGLPLLEDVSLKSIEEAMVRDRSINIRLDTQSITDWETSLRANLDRQLTSA